jgi:NAD(P)-dependent dehydrogenase (short-subunit alcohol dehydrogenase family)
VFDLACTAEIGAWVKGLAEQEGPFAGLVHCAGMHAAAPLSVLSQQKIEQILGLNVTTAVLLAKAFRQKGCCTRGASIVFLSSVAARAGSPGLSVYGASKAALAGLTKSLALELARDEIRVNCVLPGLVETEMTARLRQTLTPEQFQGIAAEHPLGIGSARDVAHAIAFLLAGTGRWITGSELIVDGGYTAH